MSRHVEVVWVESAEELYRQYRAERDVRRRQWLQVCWLVRVGGRRRRLAGRRGWAGARWRAG
jgi:hypothetical protein